jgi:aspartate/methionine/tyrosine aminotransferase
MNFAPPKWVTAAAEKALNEVAPNHYSHPKGRIRLREAIKTVYEPTFGGRTLDVESNILITSGANEGATINGRVPNCPRSLLFKIHRSILGLRRLPGARR